MAVLEALQEGMQIEDILLWNPNDFYEAGGEEASEVPTIRHYLRKNPCRGQNGYCQIRWSWGCVPMGIISQRLQGIHVDACIVIHGDIGVLFGEEGRYPVSASFYTNSFLHKEGGVFDLTQLATYFDPDGGGHANAGCRVKAIRNGSVVNSEVSEEDVEKNITKWLEIWSKR